MEPEKAKNFQKYKIVNFPSLDHGAVQLTNIIVNFQPSGLPVSFAVSFHQGIISALGIFFSLEIETEQNQVTTRQVIVS